MRGTARVPFVGHAAHFYMHVVPAQALLALQPPARRSSLRERPGHLGYALVLKRHGNLPSAFPPFMPNSLRLEIGATPCAAFFSCLPAGSRPSRAQGRVPSSIITIIMTNPQFLSTVVRHHDSYKSRRCQGKEGN